jgi:hypothetical protein
MHTLKWTTLFLLISWTSWTLLASPTAPAPAPSPVASKEARLFVSIDPQSPITAQTWEVAKEIAMRLPLGGAATTKAYQQIYLEKNVNALLLEVNGSNRQTPYVIKSKSLGFADLQIAEIFPNENVDKLVLAYLEAKNKFAKMNNNRQKISMLIVHSAPTEACEQAQNNRIDCPLEGQFHQFLRKLPPGHIDLIVRPGATNLIGQIRKGLYVELPAGGHMAYDISVTESAQITATPVTLCKYVSRHSSHCPGTSANSSDITSATYMGQSIQRQINTLLSSQTGLSPGLQKPERESL